MQRVRIGITGLAVVFLVVLLAAAIASFQSKQDRGSVSGDAEAGNATQTRPADPLAELGVAPGGTAGESPSTPSNATHR